MSDDCPGCGSMALPERAGSMKVEWRCGTYQMVGLEPTRSPKCWSISTAKATDAYARGYEAATRDAVAFFRENMELFERTGYGFAEAMFEAAIRQLERREHVGAGDAK